MASFSTIAVETLAGGATGALCGFPSSTADQHQMFEHSRAGQTRGDCCAQTPVAPYELQACELGGRVDRPSFSRIQIDRFLPLSRLRVRAVTGCGSLFHSSRNGARKPFARLLPVEQVYQGITHRDHVSSLPSDCTVREDCCATKGLENARKAFGEIRNV